MVRRDGDRVRCFTSNGHDWADRFPSIVEAALRHQRRPFLIDGEAVILSDDGTSDFHALRGRGRGGEVILGRLRPDRTRWRRPARAAADQAQAAADQADRQTKNGARSSTAIT